MVILSFSYMFHYYIGNIMAKHFLNFFVNFIPIKNSIRLYLGRKYYFCTTETKNFAQSLRNAAELYTSLKRTHYYPTAPVVVAHLGIIPISCHCRAAFKKRCKQQPFALNSNSGVTSNRLTLHQPQSPYHYHINCIHSFCIFQPSSHGRAQWRSFVQYCWIILCTIALRSSRREERRLSELVCVHGSRTVMAIAHLQAHLFARRAKNS